MWSGAGDDPAVEDQLDRWVEAKRTKDFATADAIRAELRDQGIDPDTARPSDRALRQHGLSTSSLGHQPVASFMYDQETEDKLDQWVEAKRGKDFATADALRSDLRNAGVDPDTARPSDKASQNYQQSSQNYQQASQHHQQAQWSAPASRSSASMRSSAGSSSWSQPRASQPRATVGYDPGTEDKLDQWVEAKRNKDFATADALRQDLRAYGIDPDTVRPADKSGSGKNLDRIVDAKLDKWVVAKRQKDFATADALRGELRGMGIDPDTARPSDRDAPMQPMVMEQPPRRQQMSRAAFESETHLANMPMAASSSRLPPLAAPSRGGGGGGGSGQRAKYGPMLESKLDRWVEAKRGKDWSTADSLRQELRALGIDPDTARPADKDSGGGGGASSWASTWSSTPPHSPQQRMQQVTDDWTEAQLDRWVQAKRDKDFSTADAIRNELRGMGLEPDHLRPSDKDMGSTMGSAKKYDSYTETRLEQWVQAKRDKDFSTADAIRAELRAKGVEPDLVRPSDKDGNMQAMPVGMVGASAMQYGASSFQQPGFAMAGQMYPQGHGYQMMEPMMLPGAAPMGATSYDAETEAQLDRWVQAKREKDFITSDALRMALRAKSIEPDKARPSDKDGNWHSDVGSATKRFRGS